MTDECRRVLAAIGSACLTSYRNPPHPRVAAGGGWCAPIDLSGVGHDELDDFEGCVVQMTREMLVEWWSAERAPEPHGSGFMDEPDFEPWDRRVKARDAEGTVLDINEDLLRPTDRGWYKLLGPR